VPSVCYNRNFLGRKAYAALDELSIHKKHRKLTNLIFLPFSTIVVDVALSTTRRRPALSAATPLPSSALVSIPKPPLFFDTFPYHRITANLDAARAIVFSLYH
jgi:hypothetical protein